MIAQTQLNCLVALSKLQMTSHQS